MLVKLLTKSDMPSPLPAALSTSTHHWASLANVTVVVSIFTRIRSRTKSRAATLIAGPSMKFPRSARRERLNRANR